MVSFVFVSVRVTYLQEIENKIQSILKTSTNITIIHIKFSRGGTASQLINSEFQWLPKGPSFFLSICFLCCPQCIGFVTNASHGHNTALQLNLTTQ